MVFDEKGRSMDKKAFVADQTPLPPGYSGAIKLVNPQSRILPDAAILSYDLNETETIFGQNMWARYHATDTWVRRHGQWQIVAEQVLRYYEDPGAGKPEVKKYPDYAGTYELTPGITLKVSAEGQDLYSQRSGRARELLVPEASLAAWRVSQLDSEKASQLQCPVLPPSKLCAPCATPATRPIWPGDVCATWCWAVNQPISTSPPMLRPTW
jgi:hypothetical protein